MFLPHGFGPRRLRRDEPLADAEGEVLQETLVPLHLRLQVVDGDAYPPAHSGLTKFRARIGGVQGNQVHSSIIQAQGIPKIKILFKYLEI